MNSEAPLLVDTGRGFTVKWNNRYLLSPYSPEEKCKKAAEAQKLLPQTLYILVHPLFGYGLDLLKARLPDQSYILCIETSEELFAATSSFLNEDLIDPEKLTIYRTNSPSTIFPKISELGLWRFRRCLPLNAGCGLKEEKQADWVEWFQLRLNQYWKNRLTLIRLGSRWLLNILRNIPALKENRPLPRTEKNLLLCGAGPSLDTIIPPLSGLREDYFILAVDTAFPSLSSRGIIPDAVVNVDGQYYNSLDFYFQDPGVLRFSDLTAYPATLREGQQSLFCSRFSDTPFLENMEESLSIPFIPPMGSVALSALELAQRISPRGKIILAGLDFAYIPGDTHAKGSIFHQHYQWNQNRLSPDACLTEQSLKRDPRSPGGGVLKTDKILESYHQDLVEYINGIDRDLYQWKPQGLPLPCKRYEPADEILNIEKSSHTQVKQGELGMETYPSFLKEWKSDLEILSNLWNSYADETENSEKLIEKMKEMDYLYFDSPSNPPLPQENPRIITLIMRRVRKLETLLSLHKSPPY